jgi:ferredoxin
MDDRRTTPGGRTLMKVTVDELVCEAYGICAMTVPEVFEVDTDAGHSRVLDEVPDATLHALVLEAQPGPC